MEELSVLLVDDEQDWLESLRRTLYSYGITGRDNIHLATNGPEMFELIKHRKVDLIILDLFLADAMGEDLLVQILAHDPTQYVIFMTGCNNVETAVECMKKGARDYLIKSTPVSELVDNIKRIAKIRSLELENQYMKSRELYAANHEGFSEYLTRSPQIFHLFDYIRSIAKTSHHVLITGESGVGKGIMARIVAHILRPGKPFVSVNVAGYDDQMFADALFGHVKGAFTGADRHRNGMISQAGGGVLFLDEIGDISLQSQVKLLYLLQDSVYQQLGSDETIMTTVKFIFASNQDLSVKLGEKKFRNDLFFRLNTHRIHIPPLRQRPEDIPLLVAYFAKETASELGKETPVFSDSFMEKIQSMPLPGNTRQLKSIIYDLVTRHGGVITVGHLDHPEYSSEFSPVRAKVPDRAGIDVPADNGCLPTLGEMTDQLIRLAMQKSGGNQVGAARMLQISQPTLSRKLKKMQRES